jgi:hypothetical protein
MRKETYILLYLALGDYENEVAYPLVLSTHDTLENAQKAMKKEIRAYEKEHKLDYDDFDDDLEISDNNMFAFVESPDIVQWSIVKI